MFSFFLYLSFGSGVHAADVLPKFSLVGLYDVATIMNLSKVDGSSFHWVPSKDMNKSCGNAKFPYKMNIMEADAVSSGMTPALVVLLGASGLLGATLSPLAVCLLAAALLAGWLFWGVIIIIKL